MADKWQGVIFACDECKLTYGPATKGVCPKHKTEMTVAFPSAEIPVGTMIRKCPECGSESEKATYSNRGKIGELRTAEPHCPDCGSTNQFVLVGPRGLTDAERKVLTENAKRRSKDYERVSAYPAAKGG